MKDLRKFPFFVVRFQLQLPVCLVVVTVISRQEKKNNNNFFEKFRSAYVCSHANFLPLIYNAQTHLTMVNGMRRIHIFIYEQTHSMVSFFKFKHLDDINSKMKEQVKVKARATRKRKKCFSGEFFFLLFYCFALIYGNRRECNK